MSSVVTPAAATATIAVATAPNAPSIAPTSQQGVGDDVVQKFLTELRSNLLVEIDNLMENFAYNGFDPVIFRAMLIKFLTVNAQNQTIRTLADAAVIVRRAIMVVVARGTKIKDLSKMKAAGQQLVNDLSAAGVIVNPAPGSLGATAITLQRIAASFAIDLSLAMGTRRGRVVGNIPSGFPYSLCTPNAMSFIPDEIYNDANSPIMAGMRMWRESFAIIVNSGNSAGRNKTEAEVKDSNKRFERIVFDSRLYSKASRMDLLSKVLAEEYRNLKQDERIEMWKHLDTAVKAKVTAIVTNGAAAATSASAASSSSAVAAP